MTVVIYVPVHMTPAGSEVHDCQTLEPPPHAEHTKLPPPSVVAMNAWYLAKSVYTEYLGYSDHKETTNAVIELETVTDTKTVNRGCSMLCCAALYTEWVLPASYATILRTVWFLSTLDSGSYKIVSVTTSSYRRASRVPNAAVFACISSNAQNVVDIVAVEFDYIWLRSAAL